jgi:Na+/proline symporter
MYIAMLTFLLTLEVVYGVRISFLLAGAVGGFLFAHLIGKAETAKEFFSGILVGSVAAGYMTPLFLQWMPFLEKQPELAAFCVGLMGKEAVTAIILFIRSKLPKDTNGKSNNTEPKSLAELPPKSQPHNLKNEPYDNKSGD